MDCIATREKTFRKQVSKAKVRTPLRRVRLWTRLSPAHLLRAFVDNYVKGCVTFANDSEVDARASALYVVCDDNGAGFSSASRSRYAQGRVASARELLDLSSKFDYQGSVQGAPAPEQGSVHLAHKHHAIVTGCHGFKMADQQGYSSPLHEDGALMVDLQGSSGALRSSSPNVVDEVPESKQQTDINVSKGGLHSLLQTSALHPAEFLQSASRRGTAFGVHRLSHLVPRGGSGRMLRRQRSRSGPSASVSPIAMSSRLLTPVTDMSTFREQSRRRKPSRRSLSRPASSLAVRRPNPASRDYDNRAPPPTAASPRPFLDAMYNKI